MWAGSQANPGANPGASKGRITRSTPEEFRVVERVAYAHPVRDHQAYYAPKGKNQYEQRQPPPIPPHNHSSNQVGYPFFNNPGASGGHPNADQHGRARVRREHNSECVLYDPSESVVVSLGN